MSYVRPTLPGRDRLRDLGCAGFLHTSCSMPDTCCSFRAELSEVAFLELFDAVLRLGAPKPSACIRPMPPIPRIQ